MKKTAPIITCARHRMQIDGKGVTTLVLFYGCPLRCRWCLNSYSFSPDTQRKVMTTEELYHKVKIDNLYFLATGGGITFGGGEPLLYPDFLAEFCGICPDSWNMCVETSLSVPWENILAIANYIDIFYIDCKDSNPEIYERYTGSQNDLMIDNLKKLLSIVPAERIILRLPLIPSYNTEDDRQKSLEFFKAMGITQFDEFTYIVKD